MATATATDRRRDEWVSRRALADILGVDEARAARIAEAHGIKSRRYATCARQWSRADAERVAREAVDEPASAAG